MNPVLKISLEISEGVKMYDNRSCVITEKMIENYPDSNVFNSIYFTKNNLEFRVSNHELPNRDFMESTIYINSPKTYHKNNIEVIVSGSEIVNTKLNFN